MPIRFWKTLKKNWGCDVKILSGKDKEFIIEGLLLKLKDTIEAAESLERNCKSERIQNSIFKDFLVNEKPELTEEFANYVLAYLEKSRDYGLNRTHFARMMLDALDYHRDVIDNDKLEEVLETLRNVVLGKEV